MSETCTHHKCRHCHRHKHPEPTPIACPLAGRNRELEAALVRARHESSCWQVQLANTRTELHRAEAIIERLRAKLAAAHKLTHDLESVTKAGGDHG